MKFADPAAWQWAWLALPIVACYLARVRATRVAVSTILFWQRAAERSPPRWHARLPRRWVSLAAQLTIAACLVLALAEPFFASDPRAPRRWALVVDESASMGATDEQPTRLQAAIRLARRYTDAVRPGDSVAIVAAGSRPSIVQPPTDDREALHLTLDELGRARAPCERSDCVNAAVALARRIINADASFAPQNVADQIVLLSDGCFPGADQLAAAPDVELVRVGTATGNLAITACGARRDAGDPAACRLLIEVTNFSASPAETGLVIDVGERTIELATLRLEPEEVWQKTIPLSGADLATMADGGTAVVRLTTTDALLADNRVSIVLPTRAAREVILVSTGNRLLQAALEAQPGIKLTVVERWPNDPACELPSDAITVFDGETPASLPAGRLLVVTPVNSCECWTIGGKLEHAEAAWQERGSPLLAGVCFEQARLDGVRRLTFSSPAHALATTQSGDALYAALERSNGRLLVLAASTDEGDLPRRTTFPILIGNALAWLGADSGSGIRPRIAIASGMLDRHESDLRPARKSRGSVRSGIRENSSRNSACSGIRENSGPNPLTQPDFARNQLRKDAHAGRAPAPGDAPRPFASLVLAGGLGCVVVEWWLYQRRGVR